MNTQQFPEHILKQADEMAYEAVIKVLPALYDITYENYVKFRQADAELIRDTLNLPALLMAREELDAIRKFESYILQRTVASVQGGKTLDGADSVSPEEDFHDKACDLIRLQDKQLTQHQQVLKQLAAALYKQLPISEKLSEVKWDAIKAYEALSIAKQLLEKKV